MARETATYRDNLERLNELMPGSEMMTVSDVSRALGVCRASAKDIVDGHLVNGKWVSKATLARLLAK